MEGWRCKFFTTIHCRVNMEIYNCFLLFSVTLASTLMWLSVHITYWPIAVVYVTSVNKPEFNLGDLLCLISIYVFCFKYFLKVSFYHFFLPKFLLDQPSIIGLETDKFIYKTVPTLNFTFGFHSQFFWYENMLFVSEYQ